MSSAENIITGMESLGTPGSVPKEVFHRSCRGEPAYVCVVEDEDLPVTEAN
ncbi:GD22817 [Drosophila simulans]|uniref:GD22817 n=1 Tax=Drosophila simulans TaxID=7240 RepID=B4Q8H6_DROSI|nr:GD22817 [Drosophila simulans]